MPFPRDRDVSTEIPEHLRLRRQPKQARSREAFEKILDAAIDLAAEEGLVSVNTNAIADRAGMDVASLYRTFPNKESVLYWAADRWLARVRSVCDAMDDPMFAELSWRDFLARMAERISALPEYRKAYLPFRSLWANFPEFQALLGQHYDYLVQFHLRHLRRLGATLPAQELEDLVYYLIISSDLIRDIGPTLPKKREEALYQRDYETWMAHLSRILPD